MVRAGERTSRLRGGVLLLAATAVTVSATAGLALVPSVLGRALLLALLFCAAPIMNGREIGRASCRERV